MERPNQPMHPTPLRVDKIGRFCAPASATIPSRSMNAARVMGKPIVGWLYLRRTREKIVFVIGVSMQVLARAVIQAITFLSLSDDRVLQPDVAVKVLEDIAYTLRASTHDEIAALQSIIQEEPERLRTDDHPHRDELVVHYQALLDNLGLTTHDSSP